MAAPAFPALSGRVVDAAHILPPDIIHTITARAQAIEADTGAQLVVVTVPTLDGLDIADYGYRLGRHWGIGQKRERGGRGDNGVLLLVAPNERRVRIEVGYGLEPVLTDALADTIIRRRILPEFRAGKLPAGTLAGALAIADVIAVPPEEWSQHQAPARNAAAADAGDGVPFGGIAFFGMLGAWLWLAVSRRRQRRAHPTPVGKAGKLPPSARRGRRGRRGPPLILWGPGFWSGRDDDDHRGGFGGGGFGGGGFGGGFGGGGGSFGGGGASGGW